MKPATRLLAVIAAIAMLAATASIAGIRPKLLQGTELVLPAIPGQDTGSANTVYAVSADGDWALVSAALSAQDVQHRRSGAYLFRRAAPAVWNYAGALVEVPGDENFFVFVAGNVAVVSRVDSFRVFEHGATGWSESQLATPQSRYVLAVENGSIYTADIADCSAPVQQLTKASDGRWTVTGNVVDENCDTATLDIGGGSALFYMDPAGVLPNPSVFRDTGAFNWQQVAEISPPTGAHHPGGTISGSTAAFFARDRDGGPFVMAEAGGSWTPTGRFVATE